MSDALPQKPILELEALHVAYGGVAALHGVSLEVFPQETVALIGANGAGKSTTLRAISGLLKARAGAIRFEGRPIHNLAPDRIVAAGIAHCPEERHVWAGMTVEENVTLGAYLNRSRAESQRRKSLAFERFPRLRERARQLAGTLSGGEQQMLAIARALMSEPKLLLLDEPSLGLSPKMVDEVFEVIRAVKAGGVTVLLVEQNVHNALAAADRAYVVETGRVTVGRSSESLRGDPELLRAYLGGAATAGTA
jgi:branched-chain amino acid transport system ATP-binding protein